MRHSLEIGVWYDQARYSKLREKLSDILSWRGYGPFPVPVEVGLSCCSASKGRCTRHYIETELQSLSPQGGKRSIILCFFSVFFWGVGLWLWLLMNGWWLVLILLLLLQRWWWWFRFFGCHFCCSCYCSSHFSDCTFCMFSFLVFPLLLFCVLAACWCVFIFPTSVSW